MTNPVDIDVIESSLDLIGITGISRTESSWRAQFGPWAGVPGFTLMVIREPNSPVVVLRARPGIAFPASDRDVVLAACNEWHLQRRWPRLAVLEVEGSLLVEADLQLTVEHGLTPEELATWLATFLSAVQEFWTTMSPDRPAIDGVMSGLAELLDAVRRGDDASPGATDAA